MLAKPTKDRASAPKAEVVVMPMLCNRVPGSIAPHISVTIAGKCAVTKDN